MKNSVQLIGNVGQEPEIKNTINVDKESERNALLTEALKYLI